MKAKINTASGQRPCIATRLVIWLIAIISALGVISSTMVTSYAVTTVDVSKVALANTDDGVELTWNLIEGADSYEIYRKTGSGDYIKVAIADATENSWVDESVSSGTTYTYYVKPISETTTWSCYSTSITYKSARAKALSTTYNVFHYLILASAVVCFFISLHFWVQGFAGDEYSRGTNLIAAICLAAMGA